MSEIFGNTGHVHHAWAKEELKPKKLTIVLAIDSCLIHVLGMGSGNREHPGQDEFEVGLGEMGVSPLMTMLKHIQYVSYIQRTEK